MGTGKILPRGQTEPVVKKSNAPKLYAEKDMIIHSHYDKVAEYRQQHMDKMMSADTFDQIPGARDAAYNFNAASIAATGTAQHARPVRKRPAGPLLPTSNLRHRVNPDPAVATVVDNATAAVDTAAAVSYARRFPAATRPPHTVTAPPAAHMRTSTAGLFSSQIPKAEVVESRAERLKRERRERESEVRNKEKKEKHFNGVYDHVSNSCLKF